MSTVKSHDKYSLEEKCELALEVKPCMMSYDEEVESIKGKTHYYKRKRHVHSTPKGGYLAKAVRSFYSNMTKIKSESHEMRNATKFATRCYEKLEAGDFEGVKAKRFRSVGNQRHLKFAYQGLCLSYGQKGCTKIGCNRTQPQKETGCSFLTSRSRDGRRSTGFR